MDNNNRIIEQIEKIKQIKRGENLVIFVGAGVSKNSGVCSWWELVKEISDRTTERYYFKNRFSDEEIAKRINAVNL